MNSKEFFIETPPFRVAAKSWGDASLPKVLALHGWLDNLASFEPMAPHLPNMHLVAIDILGHGLSDHRPLGSIYHFLDAVPHIVDVVDALGWENFSLMGHSMGAGIAPLVAATLPGRVEKLVLIEGLGPLSRAPEEVPAQLVRYLSQAKEQPTKRLPLYKTREEAAQMRKNAGDLSLESAKILTERGLKQVEGGWTWRADPRLRLESPLRMSEEQVLAFLKKVTCPALYLEAERGLKWNAEIQEKRKSFFPRLQAIHIRGGHHMHMDDPLPCAHLIRNFFEDAVLLPDA